MTGHLSELRGRRLAQQLHGRVFASLPDVHAAAAAHGWTDAALDDALKVLADRARVVEDLLGGFTILGEGRGS